MPQVSVSSNCPQIPVMWSESLGLTTRPVLRPKKSVLVSVLQVWCCVVLCFYMVLLCSSS